MFRSIALLSINSLPAGIQSFYIDLGLITLDYEFGKPGCGGTASDFVSVYFFNLMLLLMAAAPILLLMPLLICLGYVIENGTGRTKEQGSRLFIAATQEKLKELAFPIDIHGQAVTDPSDRKDHGTDKGATRYEGEALQCNG